LTKKRREKKKAFTLVISASPNLLAIRSYTTVKNEIAYMYI